ncbi:MAG: 30S ribosomal protein S9 [Patescibacteria group bacterium]|nr:30S ribosomal protein S9 [Patescibacteria group bacterium]MDD5715071.1 30S ribosomal protein S9 [Patescibacteria group bacterium]
MPSNKKDKIKSEKKKAIVRKKVVRRVKQPTKHKPAQEPVKAEVVKVGEKPPIRKKLTYIFGVGRRKSAIARVRHYPSEPFSIVINDKKLEEYFPYFEYQKIIKQPFEAIGKAAVGQYKIKVIGGGPRGQAESIRLGISRTLFLSDSSLKPMLRAQSLLTTDSRVKERKKYGLKKARRAPQWQKR